MLITFQYNGHDNRNNPYDDRNVYNNNFNPFEDIRSQNRSRDIYNPSYNDGYDNRNRYTNQDYEQYRLDLERKNRLEDANLRRILADVDKLSSSECFTNVAAQWNFETNVNEATQQESVCFCLWIITCFYFLILRSNAHLSVENIESEMVKFQRYFFV